VLTNKNKFAGRRAAEPQRSPKQTFCLSAADTLLLVPRSGNCAPAGELNCKRAGFAVAVETLRRSRSTLSRCLFRPFYSKSQKQSAPECFIARRPSVQKFVCLPWPALWKLRPRKRAGSSPISGAAHAQTRALSLQKKSTSHTQTALERFLRFLHNLTPLPRGFFVCIPYRERDVLIHFAFVTQCASMVKTVTRSKFW
jgi:hypothetical protein